MHKEIKRIDDKVKSQMEMLKEHTKMRAEFLAKKLDGETRVTYLKDLETRKLFGERLDKASLQVMEITTAWNLIKKEMDESCMESDNPDADKFEAAMWKILDIFPREAADLASKIKMVRRWYKFETPLRTDLLNQIDFMRRVKKNAPKHLKRMRMSPAKRRAADKQSFNMKMRWGSY